MGVVVTVVNQKGGVAKSTTVSALAYILVEKGYRVLCVNLDPQRNLDMLAGPGVAIQRDDLETLSILDVLKKKCSIQDIVIQTELGDLARASNQLYNWTGEHIISHEEFDKLKQSPDELVKMMEDRFVANSDTKTGNVYVLEQALTEVKADYDYIILDTNPSLTALTLNALYAADYLVIPAYAEESSLQAIVELWETVMGITYYNPSQYLKVAGILVTRCNIRTLLNQGYINKFRKMADKMGTILFNTKIRNSISVSECMADHTNVMKYENGRSNPAEDYRKFADEFIKRIEEMEAKRHG